MALTTALVVGGIGAAAYGAKEQAGAAKSAAKSQAQGVANAQAATEAATQAALPEIKSGFEGARQVIQGGSDQAAFNLLRGQGLSEATLGNSYGQSNNYLTQGYSDARGDLNNSAANAEATLGDTYNQSRFDLSTGANNAADQYRSGYGAAEGQMTDAYGAAQNTLQPTSMQGAGASQLQSALSGALGPEAQAQAFASYQDSPGQKFLQAQQEQALLRNEAAMGGGLSAQPGVQAELQQLAAGNAMQNYNNNFSQLGTIAQRGDTATQGISALQAGLGQSRANIQTQLAGLLGGISQTQGAGLANLSTNYGSALSGLQTQAGINASNLGVQRGTALSNLQSGYGTNLANMQSQGGANMAGLNQATATQLAQSLQGQGTTTANTYLGQGSEQAQLAQNLGVAKSGGAMYTAQNGTPLTAGINTGLGLLSGLGGLGGLGYSPPPNQLSGSALTSQNLGASQQGYSSQYFP